MHPNFAHHRLNPTGLVNAAQIAEVYDGLLRQLQALGCADGREFALAKTHLEIACFYSKKAMATRPDMQEFTPT